MLRRIANHLFWTARNLERAEWRARLVNVNYHLLVESPPEDSEPWAPLLAITGESEVFAEHHSTSDETSVLTFFTFDDENPSSIRSCIQAARENARALRHRISSELWLELNTLHLDSLGWSMATLESAGMYSFFSDLSGRFYRIAGITSDTLTRDPGYDFFTIGKMLERTESVARLLDVKYHFLLPRIEDVGGSVDLLQWAALLRSASALEAYRRAYGNTIEVEQVVEMLLLDESFPRSAKFSMNRLETSLGRIAALVSNPSQPPIEPRQLASDKLSAMLASSRAREVIGGGMHEYLLQIQDECAAIGDAVFAEYLRFE
ncbi:MAG TPA: alpha-E domain-containing protein [Candidatus Binataceae bacterium]|nr:alpha-E domain-containing protein [Candidatus Binataceae bacterium]